MNFKLLNKKAGIYIPFLSGMVRVGLFLLMATYNLHAQVRIDDNGDIENTEIVIEKNKKIAFPEIQKKYDKITLPPKKSASDPKEYSFKEIQSPVADLETKIKISTIKEDLASRKKINYIRGGIGNYITTYLEGQLLVKSNPKYQLGLHARHFGSILGPVKNSLTSSNAVEGHAKYFFPKAIHSASADYTRTVVNYYGYNHSNINNDDSKLKDTIYQVYQQIAVRSELSQVDTLSKLQYNVKANYFNFSNKFKNSENELEVAGNVNYEIDKSSKFYINTNISASNYTDAKASLGRYLFNIRPEYERKLLGDKFLLKGGINFAYENDTLSTTKRVHIYPIINADYQLLSKLNVYAGIDGGMEKNNFRTLVNQNPFLGLNPTLLHTNKLYELYAGLRGKITNTIHFKTTLSYNAYQNFNVYVNNIKDNSKFDVYYDNAKVLKWKTEIGYEPTQSLKLGLRGTYFNYQTDTLKQAWHLPTLDITAYASYNLFNKIWFSTELYYLGGIKAVDYKTGTEINLNDIVDINLSANYKINDRFSVFMYFYNILSQNYQRYNLYQSKGLTVMGGLTYTF